MEGAVNSTAEVLPSEVLETIFSYCTHRDLVLSIQNVCSRWRELVQTTRLWKNVVYCPGEDASSEEVVEMLKISPKLQNIIFKVKCDDRVLQAITDNCAELRKLQISGLPDLDLKFIKNLQENCPKVEHMSIPHPVLTDLDKCEVVGRFTNLRVLLLTGSPVTRFLINLKPVADHCKELEQLVFENAKFEINDLNYLLCMRKGTLHTLGVCCCNESGECVLPAVSLCKLKSLSLFNYWHCHRHHKKIEHFGQLKTVRVLKIGNLWGVTSDHIKQIFENENMRQLVELSIRYSRYFGDNVIEVIVRNCPLLRNLTVKSCRKMTDASLKIMCNFKELNYLCIHGNNCVTDTGIFHLRDVQGLNCLRIGWCRRLTKVGLGNIAQLSTLRYLSLEWQNLAEFPWDLILRHMRYLRCLGIYHCRNVDICAIEKLKTDLPYLNVDGIKVLEDCTSEACL
ncbi:F-box/LRR-repeat protein 2 [Anabrus simplex]|uniref:F-box/LRR-repeat protein 2 n=1 Tax=Anabrus simplex TaxID=316456 RepID=UPI0035A292F0